MTNENGRNRRTHGGFAPIFAVLFLVVVYACSDTAVAPHASSESEFFANGVVSSTHQVVENGKLVYVGSVSGSVAVKKTSRGFEATGGGGIPQGSMSPKGSKLPTEVPFGFPTLKATAGVSANHTSGPPPVWRARLNTKMKKFTTADGKTVSVQIVNDARGGGRPPVWMMLYDGSRPTQSIEFKYAKDGKKWRVAEARSTIFGADGRPSKVITSDFRAVQQGSLNVGSRLNITPLMREIGSEFGRLFQPDVLYAATVAEELDEEGLPACLGLKIEVAGLTLAVAAEAAGLLIIGGTCVTTLITCPAWLAAVVAYEATVLILAATIIQLYECQHPTPPPPPPPVTRGSGGPSGGESSELTCTTVYWEISYDGGLTWQPFYEEEFCEVV